MKRYLSLILLAFYFLQIQGQNPLDTSSIINKIDQQVLCINEDTTLVNKTIDNSIRKKKGFIRRRLTTVSADSLGIVNAFYKEGQLVKITHSLRFTQSVFYFNNSKLVFVVKSCFEILPPLHQQRQTSCFDRREKHNLYFMNEGFFRKSISLKKATVFSNHCGGCLNDEELTTVNILQLMNKCKFRLKHPITISE